jgi:hypothetical protein
VKCCVKAIIPSTCCFVALGYIGWHMSQGSGEFRLDKGYKVDIIAKGPDGKIIPAIGRAPK